MRSRLQLTQIDCRSHYLDDSDGRSSALVVKPGRAGEGSSPMPRFFFSADSA